MSEFDCNCIFYPLKNFLRYFLTISRREKSLDTTSRYVRKRSILSLISESICSIFVSRISKNYYHNVRNETKGSGGKVEGSRANRDT